MQISRTSAFTVGAVMALVIGSGTAYAANGGTFRLGMSNSASAVTTLTNSTGTSLSLRAPAGKAPLAVNNSTRVTNLNADKLDGVTSGDFALKAGQAGTIWADSFYVSDEFGDPIFVASVAMCPPNTKLVGGGGIDSTPGGAMWFNAPLSDSEWGVASTWTPDTSYSPDGSGLLEADAQCYNPRGEITGAAYRAAPSAEATAKLQALAAKRQPR